MKFRKKLCKIIFWLSVLFLFGIVGGLEKDYITMKESLKYFVIGFVTMYFTGYKSGFFR